MHPPLVPHLPYRMHCLMGVYIYDTHCRGVLPDSVQEEASKHAVPAASPAFEAASGILIPYLEAICWYSYGIVDGGKSYLGIPHLHHICCTGMASQELCSPGNVNPGREMDGEVHTSLK